MMVDAKDWPPRFTVVPMTPDRPAQLICDVGEVHEHRHGRVNWDLLRPAIQQLIEDAYRAGIKTGESNRRTNTP